MASSPRPPSFKRRLTDGLFNGVGAPLLGLGLRALGASLRFEIHGLAHYLAASVSGRPVVAAFWHEDLISIALFYLRMCPGRVAVMVSRSRDGAKLDAVLQQLGMQAVRASSSRGAVQGLLEMIDWLDSQPQGGARRRPRRVAPHSQGAPAMRIDAPHFTYPIAAIALDGPRGPRREAKPGAGLLAAKTGALLLPCAFRADRQWVFRSWDRTRLPKPRAVLHVAFGTPREVPPDGDPATMAAELQAQLGTLQDRVDTACALPLGGLARR